MTLRDAPPAISRLNLAVFGACGNDMRHAVYDRDLRLGLSQQTGLLSMVLLELLTLDGEIAANTVARDALPRVIMQYWHDRDRIPDDVAACMATWRVLENDGFAFELFDDRTALAFFKAHWTNREMAAFIACHHPAMRCDYFRLAYLIKRGGVYIDADERRQGDLPHDMFDSPLLLQPLCFDTTPPGRMVPFVEWSVNPRAGASWFFYLNNNPIAAQPNHPALEMALEDATQAILEAARLGQKPDIANTTGPANMGRSFFRYLLAQRDGVTGFQFVKNWALLSHSPWNLAYRNDSRDWRKGADFYGPTG